MSQGDWGIFTKVMMFSLAILSMSDLAWLPVKCNPDKEEKFVSQTRFTCNV